MIIHNTTVLAGKLTEAGRNRNKNGTTWTRGEIKLANGFGYMLDLVAQRRLDFNYTISPGMDKLPQSEVIIIGTIERTIFSNGYPWDFVKINTIITPESTLLKELGLNYEEAKEKILNKDKEFVEKLSDVDFLVKKQIETVLGTSNTFSTQMLNIYGDNAYQRLVSNPWEMIHTINYYSLEHGDKVAEYLGIALDDKRRLQAQLRQVITEKTQNTGNTYLNKSSFDAVYWTHFFGVISEDEFKSMVEESTEIVDGVHQPIVKTKLGYHPSHLYRAEVQSIRFLEAALYNQPIKYNKKQTQTINKLAKDQSFTPSDEQVQVLYRALSDPIHVLTGGPGTGKTAILNAIVEKITTLHGNNPLDPSILLISPTGKAASRMQEETGFPASTIHSAFGLAPEMSLNKEMLNDTVDKLKSIKYIIIDESSMLDSLIFGEMSKVLLNLPEIPKLLFVGDTDQLPPVGNGQVFNDIVKLIKRSYPEYFTELTQIQRQDDDSNIPNLAKMIKDGKFPEKEWFNDKADISFVDTKYSNFAKDIIKGELLPRADHLSNLQILTPYSSGDKGDTHRAISEGVSKTFNPPKDMEDTVFIGPTNTAFRVGDRVVNNINLNKSIVNGSIGKIKRIDNSSDDVWDWTILVDFGEKEFSYPREEWNSLDLAYAMTIHKSQGSEYDTVILPVLRGHSQFLSKNLLYTAVTRTKRELVLMGNYNTFKSMAKSPAPPRLTALSSWLGLR